MVCMYPKRYLLECLCSASGRSHRSDLWTLDSTSHQLHPEQTSWSILGLCRNVVLKVKPLFVKWIATASERFCWTGPVVLTQVSPGKHVKHTSRCAHHYVRGLSLELLDLATEIGPSDAGMAGCPHVVTQSQNDLLDLIRGDRSKKTKNTLVQENVVQMAWQDISTKV